MRKGLFAAAAALAALVVAGGALAAGVEGAGSKLRCFSGGAATCSIDAGSLTATLNTGSGYAGVYLVDAMKLAGAPIGTVSFSFRFDCQSTTTDDCVAGGSPRWSIPIDSTGDGVTDGYAFVDAANCGRLPGQTVDTSCPVFYGPNRYDDWAAFAEAAPTDTIGDDVTFVIADQPFDGSFSDVSISKS